ncbi:hypothetical protein EGS33_19780 [Acinetobacter sp. FDAARGOS_541]|nr:hypothetical protein EGS33_19780 [Acinetobacter sp. FDAARGOS_541]
MFFYTGRITDFRRPTHQSSLNRGLFAFLEHLKWAIHGTLIKIIICAQMLKGCLVHSVDVLMV